MGELIEMVKYLSNSFSKEKKKKKIKPFVKVPEEFYDDPFHKWFILGA